MSDDTDTGPVGSAETITVVTDRDRDALNCEHGRAGICPHCLHIGGQASPTPADDPGPTLLKGATAGWKPAPEYQVQVDAAIAAGEKVPAPGIRHFGKRSDGVWGCDTCCTGDRCDDRTHFSRRNCPVCSASGAIPEEFLVEADTSRHPGQHPMRDPLQSYDDQAARLRKITGFVPIQIVSHHLRHDAPVAEIIVSPPDDPEGRPRNGCIVGIRLFHGPREIIVDKICLNGMPVVDGPFDAAAYAVETPLLPLDRPLDSNYRGEALRFVAIPWGVFSRATPLCIYARPWGTPSARPQLCGYLVAELEQNIRDEVQR